MRVEERDDQEVRETREKDRRKSKFQSFKPIPTSDLSQIPKKLDRKSEANLPDYDGTRWNASTPTRKELPNQSYLMMSVLKGEKSKKQTETWEKNHQISEDEELRDHFLESRGRLDNTRKKISTEGHESPRPRTSNLDHRELTNYAQSYKRRHVCE